MSWMRRKLEVMEKALVVLPLRVLEGMYPEGRWISLIDGSLEYKLPLDFGLWSLVRNTVELIPDARVGSLFEHVWNKRDAIKQVSLWDTSSEDELHYGIALRSSMEGATCKIIELQPAVDGVYEVICEEGAEEEAL